MVLKISPSQMSTALGCAAAYYQKYILRRKIPPGIFLAVGSGLDEASNVNFLQKMSTREDLPLEDLNDAAVTEFNRRLLKEGLFLTKEEAQNSEKVISDAKGKMLQLVKGFRDFVAPVIQPVCVQGSISFTRDAVPGVLFRGKIDVMNDEHDVIDLKSAKGKWPKGKADHEYQPSFYIHGARESLNAKTKRFTYHILTKGKETAHHVIHTKRDPSDLKTIEERAKVIVSMRNSGLFPPCDPGDWRCGPRWCSFYLAGCKYVSERNRKIHLL